jgi:hypothetical protein
MFILFAVAFKKNESKMEKPSRIICGICAMVGMFLFVSRLIEFFFR